MEQQTSNEQLLRGCFKVEGKYRADKKTPPVTETVTVISQGLFTSALLMPLIAQSELTVDVKSVVDEVFTTALSWLYSFDKKEYEESRATYRSVKIFFAEGVFATIENDRMNKQNTYSLGLSIHSKKWLLKSEKFLTKMLTGQIVNALSRIKRGILVIQ